MVVGDQKRRRDLAKHTDLVANMHQVRLRGRLDLTHHLESSRPVHAAEITSTGRYTSLRPPAVAGLGGATQGASTAGPRHLRVGTLKPWEGLIWHLPTSTLS